MRDEKERERRCSFWERESFGDQTEKKLLNRTTLTPVCLSATDDQKVQLNWKASAEKWALFGNTKKSLSK